MISEKIKEMFTSLNLYSPMVDVSDGLVNSNDYWIKFDHAAMLPQVRELTLSILNSVDTLQVEDKIDFIEFKNQPLGNINRKKLARKGISSLRILKILMNKNGLDFSVNIANNYVLVYSRKKSSSRRLAGESIMRRRDFYFLLKRLVIQRKIYKNVFIINDEAFVLRYNITLSDIPIPLPAQAIDTPT